MSSSPDRPRVLDGTDQRRLLEQPNPRYPTGKRNRAMLILMLRAGLKVSELLALEERDIDWLSGELTVARTTKGTRRTLWINDQDIETLWDWWKERSGLETTDATVFTTLEGNPVSPRYVRAMVKRTARKAGVRDAEEVSPSTLRHSFAADLYRQTRNLRVVQRALGHAQLSSSMVYVEIVEHEVDNPQNILKTFRRNLDEGPSY